MVHLMYIVSYESVFIDETRWHRGKIVFSSLAEQKYSARDFFACIDYLKQEGDMVYEDKSDIGGM